MFLKHNIFSLFFLSLILIGCFLPGSDLPKDHTKNLDKAIHVLLFFCFTFSSFIGSVKQSRFKRLKYFAVRYVVVFAGTLTITTEFVQHFFIPRRGFELGDIIADLSGITLAVILFFFVKGKEKCGVQ